MSTLKTYIDQFISDGVLSRAEHDHFMEMVHADGEIDAEESEQISRIFRLIQEGQLKIVDEERDGFDRTELDSSKEGAVKKDELRSKMSDMKKQALNELKESEEASQRRELINNIVTSIQAEADAPILDDEQEEDVSEEVLEERVASTASANGLLQRAQKRYQAKVQALESENAEES